ncbi:hypothetical protein HPB49_000064 [Dermacentor silvarum]|uniref:Uncharacterized protein n=1 Tax=Dermacentor silvarum TaxID=543639 RepID=A0ACB8CCJ7_DERSI|nr:hypothetical protein HPB49_000064 [Dermacentor silvarum]
MDLAAAISTKALGTTAPLQNPAHRQPMHHLRRDIGVEAKLPCMPGRRQHFRTSCQPATSVWAMLDVLPYKDGHE